MYTALGLGGRHTLHPVHSAFIFKHTINTVAANSKNDLLESSGSALAERCHSHAPTSGLTVLGIHLEQVAGKQCRFITSGSSTDLDYGILAVLWVCGNKQQFYLLLNFRDSRRGRIDLLFGKRPQFIITLRFKHLPRFFHIAQQISIATCSGNQTFKVLILLGQTHIAAHIGDHRRVGNQCAHFLEARINAFKALQQ